MAREKMVTRTVTFTVATVMTLNVETCDVMVENYTLAGEPSDAKILATVPTENGYKAVAVREKWIEEKLFGLSENDFLKYATELDPTTRKTI